MSHEQTPQATPGQTFQVDPSQAANWREYYEYAQQLYEAGDVEQAQVYHDYAQQLYELSGDSIEPEPVVTEAAQEVVSQHIEPQATPPVAPQQAAEIPPAGYGVDQSSIPPAQVTAPQSGYGVGLPPQVSVNDNYLNINDVSSVAPAAAEPATPISENDHSEWAAEYTSMHPEGFETKQGSRALKIVLFVAIALGFVGAGVFFYMQSQPKVVYTTAPPPSASTNSAGDEHSYTSRPTSNRTRFLQHTRSSTSKRSAGRMRGHKGSGAQRAASSDNSSTRPAEPAKSKANKKLSKDPLGAGFDI